MAGKAAHGTGEVGNGPVCRVALIAVLVPMANLKGNVYRGRPLPLLKRFVALAEEERRKGSYVRN
jgi:hypothetical protein